MPKFSVSVDSMSYGVYLHCKDEKEFQETYEKIKHVKETVWSGCPVEEPGRYEDLVASVKREHISEDEATDRANEIINQYRDILRS